MRMEAADFVVGRTLGGQAAEFWWRADELGNLAWMLREQTARFRLREQQAPVPAIAGMTPEMLQQVAELVRAQNATGGDGGPAETQTQRAVLEEKGDDHRIGLPLDRDERGYGEF